MLPYYIEAPTTMNIFYGQVFTQKLEHMGMKVTLHRLQSLTMPKFKYFLLHIPF